LLRKKKSQVFAALGLLSCAGSAAAEAPKVEDLVVGGSGACPLPQRVQKAIFELTSASQRRLPADSRVELGDRGAEFTVEVRAGNTRGSRVYADGERDCERRVRIAAVFAVTTLIPPELAAAEPAPVTAAPPRAPAPSRAPRTELFAVPSLRLELGAFGEIGAHFAEPASVRSWGGELRGALGRGPLAMTLAVAYAPRAKLTAPELDADVARLSAVLGVRLRLLERPVDLALDAGLIGALLRLRGTSVLVPSQDDAFELGFRTGLIATPRRVRGVAPYAALYTAVFPAPREIAIAPRGVVAHTPLLYFGAALGVALGL
jgi:hypothetical protein